MEKDHVPNRYWQWSTRAFIFGFLLLGAKGTFQFIRMGQDFWYRWSGERYVLARIDPFRVAFWSNEHAGALPPDLPAELRAKAGDPVSIVDPPWVFAYGTMMYPPERRAAAVWFFLLNCCAILVLALMFFRMTAGLDGHHRAFCTAIPFANLGFSQTLGNGNYGILAVAAAATCFASLVAERPIRAGLAFALAQVKMTISAPLVILLITRRKLMTGLLGTAVLGLATLWTSYMTGISVAGLFSRMLEGANRFSVGGRSLYKVLMIFGIPKKEALISCALGIFLLCLGVAWRWAKDYVSQMAVFAVCSQIFTYHNVLDQVVLSLLIFAAARTWIEKSCASGPGYLLAVLVASALVPSEVSDTVPGGAVLQLLWVCSLGVILAYRTAGAATAIPSLASRAA